MTFQPPFVGWATSRSSAVLRLRRPPREATTSSFLASDPFPWDPVCFPFRVTVDRTNEHDLTQHRRCASDVSRSWNVTFSSPSPCLTSGILDPPLLSPTLRFTHTLPRTNPHPPLTTLHTPCPTLTSTPRTTPSFVLSFHSQAPSSVANTSIDTQVSDGNEPQLEGVLGGADVGGDKPGTPSCLPRRRFWRRLTLSFHFRRDRRGR